jgi:hypothetical protein
MAHSFATSNSKEGDFNEALPHGTNRDCVCGWRYLFGTGSSQRRKALCRRLSEILPSVDLETRGLENCMRKHGDKLTKRMHRGVS